MTYEVRLERVPGGLRLAEWAAGQLRPAATVLAAQDLPGLLDRASDAEALTPSEHAELVAAVEPGTEDAVEPGTEDAAEPETVATGARKPEEADDRTYGASPGRSGELRDELRVERLDGDRLRIARWVLRPGTGWDMLDAPTMLPARRYAQAFADIANSTPPTA